ncbi:MAG: hypothetical protein ACK5LK_00490 [Chthoniobacterales bacterium]
MRKQLPFFLAALFFCVSNAEAASDRLWAAVVVATKQASENPSKHLRPYLPTIQKSFGYPYAYIRSEESKDVKLGKTQYLRPGDGFSFKLLCEEQQPAVYLAKVEAFQNDKFLFRTEVNLARNEPLFIRGPEWGQKRILLLLAIE